MANPKFFVVVAMPHNGGHGPWPAPILITRDGLRAVAVARCVETLGFRIDWREEGVYIFLMEFGKSYARADFKTDATPYIYKRGWDLKDSFAEYFFDANLAEECGMSVSMDYGPSKPLSPAISA